MSRLLVTPQFHWDRYNKQPTPRRQALKCTTRQRVIGFWQGVHSATIGAFCVNPVAESRQAVAESQMSSISDQQRLADQARHGDQGALGQLLQNHQHRLYNVVLRMVGHRDDAADVTQEAMFKIVEHIGDFRGQSDISTWMTRIAMNLCFSLLRKRRLRRTTSLDASGGDWVTIS